MVALRPGFATLTAFRAHELLYFSMKLLHVPADGILFLNVSRGRRALGILRPIGDHPVDVSGWGDYHEESHEKRHFFELDPHAVSQGFLGPGQVLQVDLAALLGETHLPITLDGGNKVPSRPVDELQVLYRGIPVVEQDRLRLDPFVSDGPQEHLAEVILFGFAIIITIKNSVVDGIELLVFPAGMQQIDHADPLNYAMFSTAVLAINEFNF